MLTATGSSGSRALPRIHHLFLANRPFLQRIVCLILLLMQAWPAAAAQDSRRERAIQRAEKRFEQAEQKREAAYQTLVEEYETAEAWYRMDPDAPLNAPEVIRAGFEEMGVLPEFWAQQRLEMAQNKPFHEWWNESLYHHSRPAKGYAKAVTDLENAFQALEKLRHPERFTKGFEKTPSGMVLIPGGRITLRPATGYVLGYPQLQEERLLRPKPFYLDKREVSCAEYARFLLAQPPGLAEEHLPLGWRLNPEGAPSYPDGWALFPVTGISWASASSYAHWLGKRLPTETEWEIAATGLEGRLYPMGDRFSARKVNCRSYGAKAPQAIHAFPEDSTPNGLQCMAGNVREWVADLYDERPDREKAQPAKKPGPFTMAVTKGGSFQDPAESCTVNFRWLEPALGVRLAHVGFRCAMDVP